MLAKIALCALLITSTDNDFFWPKEIHKVSEEEWQPIALADAPPHFYVAGLDASNAKAVFLDLHGKGSKQLIVDDGTGGSGDRGWSIYEKKNDQWTLIGRDQGSITICTPHNGYAQIEVWSRGGGGGNLLASYSDLKVTDTIL